MDRFAALLVVALLAGCARSGPATPTEQAPPASGPGFALREVASGFEQPVLVAPDGRGGLLVAEQTGRVWSLDHRALLLDLSNATRASGEQGFLGLALVPGDASRAVASYTDLAGDTTLATVDMGASDPNATVVFHLHQPFANHNGGNVVFGPDGRLWLGLGDGGGAGDPEGNGQNRTALLASMLRFDARNGSWTPEIWAKGLRNPWRFSFDRATGDLWIGDVGQDRWEEIDRVAAPLPAGVLDFGWNAYEGSHAYPGGATPFEAVIAPVAEYGHDEGCAVTGGYVYRGAALPALRGAYLFGDYCSGRLWGLRDGTLTRLLDTDAQIASFGQDDAGELYVVDHAGRVLELVPRS